MRVMLAAVTPRRGRLKSQPAQQLVDDYMERASRFAAVELRLLPTEQALLAVLGSASRSAPFLVLLDSKGSALTSAELAATLRQQRDSGTQQLILAVGPADGWSADARRLAAMTLSFGAITLPHELALIIAAEQIYRALTILAGHPYHSGH